jgi:hypothetical protein
MRAHWEPLSGRGDVNGKSVQTVLPCNTPLTGVSPRNCGRIDRYGFALFHRGGRPSVAVMILLEFFAYKKSTTESAELCKPLLLGEVAA